VNIQEIDNRSGDQKTDNVGHRPNAAEKVDDVNITAVDTLIEIGIAQNFDETGSNAGAKQNQSPQNQAF